MKNYVVMVKQDESKWWVWTETDDFKEAIKEREIVMGQGNPEVVIFKLATWHVVESTTWDR